MNLQSKHFNIIMHPSYSSSDTVPISCAHAAFTLISQTAFVHRKSQLKITYRFLILTHEPMRITTVRATGVRATAQIFTDPPAGVSRAGAAESLYFHSRFRRLHTRGGYIVSYGLLESRRLDGGM